MTMAFLSRRSLLGGAVAGLGVAGLAGCAAPRPGATGSPSPGPGAATSITFGMTYIPNVQFSPLYVARDHGIFADHGLDVTLRHHGQQEDAFGAVVAGEEDVVLASSDEAVVAAANGAALATFATCYQRFPAEVMTPLPPPDDDPLQVLRGARLGIPGHYGSSYYAALCALHLSGLTEDDVALTDVGYTQVVALSTGKVEAIVGYLNNELVQFRAMGLEVFSLPVSDPAAPSLVGPGLVTVPGRLDDEVLRAVRESVLEAQRMIAGDPEVGLAATEKEVPTLSEPEQRASAEAVLANTIELWKGDRGEVFVDVDQAAFERMGALLTEVGIIDAPPADTVLML